MSAGAIHTPQVLQLSGIGDKTLLDKLGIQTVADVPGVGNNLQDHIHVPIVFSCGCPSWGLHAYADIFIHSRLSPFSEQSDHEPDICLRDVGTLQVHKNWPVHNCHCRFPRLPAHAELLHESCIHRSGSPNAGPQSISAERLAPKLH